MILHRQPYGPNSLRQLEHVPVVIHAKRELSKRVSTAATTPGPWLFAGAGISRCVWLSSRAFARAAQVVEVLEREVRLCWRIIWRIFPVGGTGGRGKDEWFWVRNSLRANGKTPPGACMKNYDNVPRITPKGALMCCGDTQARDSFDDERNKAWGAFRREGGCWGHLGGRRRWCRMFCNFLYCHNEAIQTGWRICLRNGCKISCIVSETLNYLFFRGIFKLR